jgi:phage terminase large subunit-like protein
LERPRGAGKTSDIATSTTFALFASRRKLIGVVAAADTDQAALLRDAVDKLVRLNPWLTKFIDVQRNVIVNPHTGSTLTIISSDAASSFGLTPDFVVCDEVTHWKKRDLWDSLLSSAAKRANALLLVICNAGYMDSWQWETRELIRQDPRWYFHQLQTLPRWLSAESLDEQRRLLPPKVYARLWLNRWASGGGDALEEADILASLTQAAPLTKAEPGYVYVAGLDLGLTRDASALVILGKHVGYSERVPRRRRQRVISSKMRALIDVGVFDAPADEPDYEVVFHPPTGRLRVAAARIWRPEGKKVELEPIENEIVALNEAFGLSAVGVDPWQAEYMMQRLTKRGITTEPVVFVPQNLQSMAQSTMEAYGNRLIDMHDEPDLLADLRALRIVEKSYGIRLDSPRGNRGHGDTATALAIALHSIKRYSALRRTARVDRSLVLSPSTEILRSAGEIVASIADRIPGTVFNKERSSSEDFKQFAHVA